ncbi:hypothetical protein NUV26_24045 [Burkholderia pseudomultivorans]|nr:MULTISPECIES: hypothetical protein [Burkholderia]MDS0795248.1 hypothetical protein [Burkholderia pseudomultivorans]
MAIQHRCLECIVRVGQDPPMDKRKRHRAEEPKREGVNFARRGLCDARKAKRGRFCYQTGNYQYLKLRFEPHFMRHFHSAPPAQSQYDTKGAGSPAASSAPHLEAPDRPLLGNHTGIPARDCLHGMT